MSPWHECLSFQDEDPHVRKKAAVAVAKLHVINANLVAQSICERITPRLAHVNAAVVLSAVRVLMQYMEIMGQDTDFVNNMVKKLSPPLVTLLSSEPEFRYVALRNINLIISSRRDLTSPNTR